MAESMGLPPALPIPPEQKLRGYITLLRRNWHLLPYDQLLVLLDMTPEQLAYALREDDFLWVKLGSLKPRCEPLALPGARRGNPATCSGDQGAGRSANFGDEIRQPAEPRFAFVRKLSAAAPPNPSQVTGNPRPSPCATSIPTSPFTAIRCSIQNWIPTPTACCSDWPTVGINGVWLHVVLRNLAPGGEAFPEFGAEHRTRLENLRKLVARAKRHGIGIYLYINEPRAMPAEFFHSRPEMAGVREGDYVALCTSHPAVRKWLTDSLAYVFRNVPDLAGVFTITASENLTNCASHGAWRQCPRLPKPHGYPDPRRGQRGDRGRRASWKSAGESDCLGLGLARARRRRRRHRRAGQAHLADVGQRVVAAHRTRRGEKRSGRIQPLGGRAGTARLRHWQLAKQAGLKTVAKVQLNNTWELSAVPYLPVMDLVAQHCHNLATAGVDGMMLSWSLGGYPSPNLEIAASFCRRPVPSIEEVLDGLAQRRFGPQGAPHARKAWTAMSRAFTEYPYHGAVLYQCPVQMGPANLLYPVATGYRATMVGFPYDDLNAWRGPYPAEVFADQFEKVAAGWQRGLTELQAAVAQTPASLRPEVEAELRFAQAARLHFQSVANQARFILLRDALANVARPLPPAQRQQTIDQLRRVVEDEIAHGQATLHARADRLSDRL